MVERIKKLCKEKNINIAKLEREIGLSNGQIGKWRKRPARTDHIKAVADYFQVTVDYILEGKENDEKKENEEKIEKDIELLIKYYKGSGKQGKKNILHIAKMEYEAAENVEEEEKKSG